MKELKTLLDKKLAEMDASDKKIELLQKNSRSIFSVIIDFLLDDYVHYFKFSRTLLVIILIGLLSISFKIFYIMCIEMILRETICKYYLKKTVAENELQASSLSPVISIYYSNCVDGKNIEELANYFQTLAVRNNEKKEIEYAEMYKSQIQTVIDLVIESAANRNVAMLTDCRSELEEIRKRLNVEIVSIKKAINNKNIEYISEMSKIVDNQFIEEYKHLDSYLEKNKSIYVQITNTKMALEQLFNYFKGHVENFNLVYEDTYLLNDVQRKRFILSYNEYLMYFSEIIKKNRD